MNQALREHTLNFWIISRTWHGHAVVRVTTEAALRNTARILNELSPKYRIVRSAASLQSEIVIGKVVPFAGQSSKLSKISNQN